MGDHAEDAVETQGHPEDAHWGGAPPLPKSFECVECHVPIIMSGWSKAMLADMKRRQLCFTDLFWHEKIDIKDRPEVVRVKHTHYIIGREDPDERFRGFGGERFIIKFHDGRRVVSTNLWCQGGIPQRYWDRLPDNAEFVQE